MNSYESLVGTTITVTGLVSNSKHPYIEGLGCWDLEDYRGKKVRVTGTVSKRVVTEEMVRPKNGLWVANEGAGVFYELVELRDVTVLP